jgi:glutamate racemase
MIGIFDSGVGGLTVFKEIKKALPDYSYVYLGDSLRSPYGGRSQQAIFEFTKQAVDYLFKQGCELVVLACNSASAEALRKLQQEWLVKNYPERRILGVIRPVAEEAAALSRFGRIGVVGTKATIDSKAYVRELEIRNSKPVPSEVLLSGTKPRGLEIIQQACPLLVPLIEEGWLKKPETRMIIKKYLAPLKQRQIDTLILGCTHYPMLMKEFVRLAGRRIKVLDAPKIVAEKLVDYLKRHPELEAKLPPKADQPLAEKKDRQVIYLTTDSPDKFAELGGKFLGHEIKAEKVEL